MASMLKKKFSTIKGTLSKKWFSSTSKSTDQRRPSRPSVCEWCELKAERHGLCFQHYMAHRQSVAASTEVLDASQAQASVHIVNHDTTANSEHGFEVADGLVKPGEAIWKERYRLVCEERHDEWRKHVRRGDDVRKKHTKRVRLGIPAAERPVVWYQLSNAADVLVPGLYTQLMALLIERTRSSPSSSAASASASASASTSASASASASSASASASAPAAAAAAAGMSEDEWSVYRARMESDEQQMHVRAITKDVQRTFGNHVLFQSEEGLDILTRLLTVFALHHPEIGYCQSLNYLGGMLLVFTKNMEHAFWMLHTLTQRVLPTKYFTDLSEARRDVQVFVALLGQRRPRLVRHLATVGVDLGMCTLRWFMCVMTLTLPLEGQLRVWDCLWCEGEAVLFRVALAIMVQLEAELLTVHDLGDMYEIINDCKSRLYDCDQLIRTAFGNSACAVKVSTLNKERVKIDEAEQQQQQQQQQ